MAVGTSNYVLHKVEMALRSFLQTQTISDLVDADIHAGMEKTKRAVPGVVCYCPSAEPVDQASGNMTAKVTVQLRSSADDSSNTELHHERAQQLYDLIATDSIAADLSAALADFTVFQVIPAGQRFAVDDPHWVTELDWNITCCGSDIS